MNKYQLCLKRVANLALATNVELPWLRHKKSQNRRCWL